MKTAPNVIFDQAPIYLKIYSEIKEKIVSGKILPGELLPSDNELRNQFQVSRHTAQHVYQLLVNEGLVIRRKGLGSYVNPISINASPSLESITLHLGGINKPNAPITQAHYQFARRVAELTRGRVHIKVHHSSEFGSGNEQLEHVVAMKLDLFGAGVDWIETVNPSWGITNMPFLFRDSEHVKTFLESPVNHELKDQLLVNNGIRVIADNWLRPPKVLVSRKPCFDLTDIRHIRFGVPQIPIFHKVWKTLGTHPKTVSWGRIEDLFKCDKLDATDAPCDLIYSKKLHRVAPYVTFTNHLYSRACIIMSEQKFKLYRSDIQDAIIQAGMEIGEHYSLNAFDNFLNDKSIMIHEGARFIETNIKPFRKRITQFADKIFTTTDKQKTLYKRIQEM